MTITAGTDLLVPPTDDPLPRFGFEFEMFTRDRRGPGAPPPRDFIGDLRQRQADWFTLSQTFTEWNGPGRETEAAMLAAAQQRMRGWRGGGLPHHPDTCRCPTCYQRAFQRRGAVALAELLTEQQRTRAVELAWSGQLHRRAFEAGLTTIEPGREHGYHCRCGSCRHDRQPGRNDVTAQEDPSCGIEFVSRITNPNDPADLDYIGRWVEMLQQWKADGGWMPDGRVSNGNHVHVANQLSRVRQWLNIAYAAYDWAEVADGGCGTIRGYNAKPTSPNNGGWTSDRGYGTIEHRLWNTPADPERLWGHLGLSIALTRWATGMAQRDPDARWINEYGDLTNHATQSLAVVAGHLDDFQTAIVSLLPSDARLREMSETLITRLRPMA